MEIVASNINQEIESVKKDIEKLESTEGWGKLSPKQQQFIKVSLYLQSRAQRKSDPESRLAVEENYWGNGAVGILNSDELRRKLVLGQKPIPENRTYRTSQDRIAGWNCHYSTFVLENDGVEKETIHRLDDSFFVGEYGDDMNPEKLIDRIEQLEFPCIVHISNVKNNDRIDSDNQLHTFVALGKVGEDVICWEKRDFHLPYQVKTLAEIFNRFPDKKNFWGVRKLRDLNQKDQIT